MELKYTSELYTQAAGPNPIEYPNVKKKIKIIQVQSAARFMLSG